MCVEGGGFHHFYQVSLLSLYGHTGVLRSGRSPLVQAFGTGHGCVPVLPLDHCNMHSRPVCVCVCVGARARVKPRLREVNHKEGWG